MKSSFGRSVQIAALIAVIVAGERRLDAQARKKTNAPPPATPAAAAPAQTGTGTAASAKKSDKATAYYNFAMAHLYSELASMYGNRGEYLNKAIEFYRAAIKSDPDAGFLSEELSDLFIQAGQIRSAVEESEAAIKQNPNDLNARRILGRIYSRLIGDPGQNRIKEDMVKKAIEQYVKIVEQEPKDLDSWLMLGRLRKVENNSADSEAAYKKALEIDSDNEDALTGLALVYTDLGDQKRATELLERVVSKNPSLRALAQLASGYEQMREYKLAAATLKRALEMSQGNPELKKAYAQNLLFADDYDGALEQFKEIVEEDPKDAQSWLRLSQIYRQKRSPKEAREASDKAKAIEPNNLEVRYNEVNLLEIEGKTGEAIQVLRDLLATTARRQYADSEKQNRVLLLERLGLLYRNSEQPKEAVDTFKQMVEIDPDGSGARATAQIIETWRGAKDFARAQEEADAAIKKYPKDRTVRLIRANLLADVGKTDAAATEIKSLMEGKVDRESYLSLAQVYEKGKNYGEMAKAIDAAEKLSESKEEKEGILFMRGAMYEKMKRFDLAEAEFRRLLEINPDNSSALNYLGYMLADRNVKLQEALSMIQKALEKEPGNGAYLDSLGWAYFRLDKMPEAEENLKRSIEKVPTDPTVRDHLGDVYYKQGKFKEAIAQWQASIDHWKANAPADQDTSEVAKVQKKLEGAKVRLANQGSPRNP